MDKESYSKCIHDEQCIIPPKRVSTLSLAEFAPHLIAEFVSVQGQPCLTPYDVARASSLYVLWRCSTCSHEWSTKIQNRTGLGRGCPVCSSQKAANKRSLVDYEQSVDKNYPKIASEFIENISKSGKLMRETAKNSSDVCRWQCSTCHHEWNSVVSNRTRLGQGCPLCGIQKSTLTRYLPKSGESLAEKYPDISGEFISNITKPDITPEYMKPKSSNRCIWRCSTCSHEWESKVSNRTASLRGCPKCSAKTKLFTRRNNSDPKNKLVNNYPEIARQAISVLDDPTMNPDDLSIGSNTVVLWECHCGIHFKKAVSQAVQRDILSCSSCTRQGKSRLEFEVASLLEVALNTSVIKHHQYKGFSEVDMFLPEYDAAIQIDPYWSHKNRNESDKNITLKLLDRYSRVIRIREEGLRMFTTDCYYVSPNPTAASYAKRVFDAFAKKWALDNNTVEQALFSGNTEWESSLKSGPSNAVASTKYAPEFVKNISRPGRTAAFIPVGSEDICLWQCQVCYTQWSQQAIHRNAGAGCPKCRKIGFLEDRNTPSPEKSLVGVYPSLAAEFVKNMTDPLMTSERIFSTNSKYIILWECNQCSHRWESTLKNRVFTTNYGCLVCAKKISAAGRMKPAKGRSLIEAYPLMAKEFILNESHPGRNPDTLSYNSRDICLWECSNCHTTFRSVTYGLMQTHKRGSRTNGKPCKHAPHLIINQFPANP